MKDQENLFESGNSNKNDTAVARYSTHNYKKSLQIDFISQKKIQNRTYKYNQLTICVFVYISCICCCYYMLIIFSVIWIFHRGLNFVRISICWSLISGLFCNHKRHKIEEIWNIACVSVTVLSNQQKNTTIPQTQLLY